ncbi:MAG: MSMEG_1061 family FMN-dependent PPOX-type flavoprotein [Actinomycetota bacterium]
MEASPFPNVLNDVDQLADHYRQPNQVVLDKDIDHIDDAAAAFIAASTFCLVGTANPAGEGDVSPKGGDPGFVRVAGPKQLLIPDLNGNNRLDSIRNIIENPNVGLLFLVPQRGETLRVNGRAWISVDDDLCELFTPDYRRPASVICVEPRSVFLHCAKCVRRGGLWNPEAWMGDESVPTSGTILAGHAGLGDDVGQAVDDALEEGYARELAQDRP